MILRHGTSRTKGKAVQQSSIMAAKMVSHVLRTSLGPKAMDKMLIDYMGEVSITNDGATMLDEMDIQHPAAKLMVEISKATDSEVGDGTTTSVVLAGVLLEESEELLKLGVHPTIIVDGYKDASIKARQILEEMAEKIDPEAKTDLLKVAKTSMMTKLVAEDAPFLAEIVVNAVRQIAEKTSKGYKVDIDCIKLKKKPGGSLLDTRMVSGVVLDKVVAHPRMPKLVENAKIALVNTPLEVERTEFGAEIRISDPEQIEKFFEQENTILKEMVDRIKETGANVMICQKGIDDIAEHFLARNGIMAVGRVKESDMTRLAKATGGRVVISLEDLSSEDIGKAELVEERNIEDDTAVFVEGCNNPKAITILIRGGSQEVVDETERALHDAIMVTKDVIERPLVVAGGGAPEMEVAYRVRAWASSLDGKKQLAVMKFADAVESIPLILADNAGADPIDTQVELVARHGEGEKWAGIDAITGKVSNMWRKSVIEPLVVKTQIIESSAEAASMILRIDQIIALKKTPSWESMSR